ncbi:MAG: HhH-GPD-type base excision DNA repair protein [Acidimicrobiales bacterium]
MPRKRLYLSGDAKADALLTTTPLALVIGLVLDQQIPLEWAFKGPHELSERLGTSLDAAAIAAMDPEKLVAVFSRRPALHRYPGSMAARVQALCRTVVDEYGGDAATIWTTARDGRDLLARVKKLPGFGDQKARIFVALLGKQLAVAAPGWEAASAPFGEPGSHMSVADIVDAASLAEVREHKQAMKAAKKAQAAGAT